MRALRQAREKLKEESYDNDVKNRANHESNQDNDEVKEDDCNAEEDVTKRSDSLAISELEVEAAITKAPIIVISTNC